MWSFAYSRLVFYSIAVLSCFASSEILHTKQGILKGDISKSRNGRTFYSFFGIPYAEPPVGELRFQSPVPAKTWEGIRDATILPPICLQPDSSKLVGQEDCLYLNVYSPKISNDSLLPVMVFTYGGRFMFGDVLPDKYGAHYFMDRDIVLVTFHYRLGILGFLSTEDEVIPGNYGLKDGAAVLEWVKKYIGDFGGDKNRVTLFGGSSGSISTALNLISPLTKGLFHRVISQSGFPFEIEKPGKSRSNAWKIGSFVGCNGNDVKTSEALLKCLKNIPAEELCAQTLKLYTFSSILPLLPWSPVIENEKVEGAFLVDDPTKLLQRESNIPWIVGITSDDGGLLAIITFSGLPMDGISSSLADLEANYKTLFPLLFRYDGRVQNDNEKLDAITETLKSHYFGEKNIAENLQGLSKMYTSMQYGMMIKECVKLYKGPKYVYYYAHKNQESFVKMYTGGSDLDMGVIHGDELISFFNWSSQITPVTKGVDLAVSERMLDLWTNFATNGDPNDKDEVTWRPAKSFDEINHLYIKNGVIETRTKLLKNELDFLESLPIDEFF